ncbi:hypothetical protein FO519_005558 [Halicephalobus sp. NKZ332]|nr:hypothetical protein FO519_005558 [Halicephalobus sp. NKZ332]
MRIKAIALIYVYATATVAPKRKITRKKSKAKSLRTVLSRDQYEEFVSIPKSGIIDDSDGAITSWSMKLENNTRRSFVKSIKEDYRGSPKTRYRAKVSASDASPKVQKAFRRYNRMLESNLSIIEILDHLNSIDKTYWIGFCEKWNIIVVPILRFNKNEYLGDLKTLVESVVGDCKWYYGHVNIKFMTNKLEIFDITDPVDFTDLDTYFDKFLYKESEQESAYERTTISAIKNMPDEPSDFGRYILIVTNLERIYTGVNITQKVLKKIDNSLIMKKTQLRIIRIEFDGKKTTQLIPSNFVNIHRIRNITTNIVRVSFIESNSLMETVRPCPPLSLKDQIEHYRYSKHYLAEKWP